MSGVYQSIVTDFKKFIQWILGCKYEKKPIGKRIQEMFHFVESPFIIIHVSPESDTWYSKIGIFVGVLILVTFIYYILDYFIRCIRTFIQNSLTEPQSTVSTPRKLSPSPSFLKASYTVIKKTEETSKAEAKPNNDSKLSEKSEKIIISRPKVKMNEPVNCVFIRPSSPGNNLQSSPSNDLLDTLVNHVKRKVSDETRSSNIIMEALPLRSSPHPQPPPPPPPQQLATSAAPTAKKSFELTGVAKESIKSTTTATMEETKRADTGAEMSEILNTFDFKNLLKNHEMAEVGNDKMSNLIIDELRKIIEGVMENSDRTEDEVESVMASMSDAMTSSFFTNSMKEELMEEDSVTCLIEDHLPHTARQIIEPQKLEDVDILIEDNFLFADEDDKSIGNVLVSDGQARVMFRWTDNQPENIDNVTITGSFFGWKMNLPMKRSVKNRKIFTICLELPVGLHEYKIDVYRFD